MDLAALAIATQTFAPLGLSRVPRDNKLQKRPESKFQAEVRAAITDVVGEGRIVDELELRFARPALDVRKFIDGVGFMGCGFPRSSRFLGSTWSMRFDIAWWDPRMRTLRIVEVDGAQHVNGDALFHRNDTARFLALVRRDAAKVCLVRSAFPRVSMLRISHLTARRKRRDKIITAEVQKWARRAPLAPVEMAGPKSARCDAPDLLADRRVRKKLDAGLKSMCANVSCLRACDA